MGKNDITGHINRLVTTWHKLNGGEWDEDILGKMPEGADPSLVRMNAAKAIEEIIGSTKLDLLYHTEILKETPAEWFRWYTVGRFRYEIQKREARRNRHRIIAVIAAILLAIAIHIVRRLLEG